VLNRSHARKARYAVLTRNTRAEWSEGDEPHGTGFIVGKISEIVPSTKTPDRWLIKFDEYAEIEMANLWPSLRNPVHYTTIEKIGIDISQLEFKPMPKPDIVGNGQAVQSSSNAVGDAPLSITDAKKRLALTFGVKPDAIEITVRG